MNLNKRALALTTIMATAVGASAAADAAIVHHIDGSADVTFQNGMGLIAGDPVNFNLSFLGVGGDINSAPDNFTAALNGVSGTFSAGGHSGEFDSFNLQVVDQVGFSDIALLEGVVQDFNGLGSLSVLFALSVAQFSNINDFGTTFAQLKNGDGTPTDLFAAPTDGSGRYLGAYDNMWLTAYDETVSDPQPVDALGTLPLIGVGAAGAASAYLLGRKKKIAVQKKETVATLEGPSVL